MDIVTKNTLKLGAVQIIATATGQIATGHFSPEPLCATLVSLPLTYAVMNKTNSDNVERYKQRT